MAQKRDRKEVVTFEELLRAMMCGWERQGIARKFAIPIFAFACSLSQREPLAALHFALQ